MWKLIRSRLTWSLVAVGTAFLIIQVICDLSLPGITSNIINKGVAQHNIPYIWNAGRSMLLISLIGIIGAICNVYFSATQSQKLGLKLRNDIFEKISYLSNFEFSKLGDASLITRTTNDVVQIQNVMIMVLRMMLMSPLMLVGASLMAYMKQPKLTVVFFVSLPLLIIFVALIMYWAVPLFKGLQKKIDNINLVFREGLTGVRVIRAFNRDQYEQDRFNDVNQDYMKTGIKVFTVISFMLPVMTLITNGANMGIVWLGGKLIANQEMQIGNLIAFMTYATQILISVMMLSMVFVLVPRASSSAARINEVLDIENSIVDGNGNLDLSNDNTNILEFNHVDFRYSGAEKLALKDINFQLNSGNTVAIIGGTGSGKTTLVSMLPRLYDPEKGSIKLNGIDIRKIKQDELHNQISFSQQKAVLFKGTVRDNLKYGNKDASDEDIWRALKIAQADEFIDKDKNGLDTLVEQNGDNFSGGQKQRLSIARSLVKKSLVYVFDDSFSALDFKTDSKLRYALSHDDFMKDKIVVIVAQRISTVADADLILVIDNGEIVGQGTHSELKEKNDTYREILDSQIEKGDQD